MRAVLKGFVGAVVLVAGAGVAAAADLPARMPAKAPAMSPVYNWTGFYAGLNAGVDWLNAGVGTGTGFAGGGQIGYNWQTANIVFGLEADIQGSTAKGSGTLGGTAGLAATESDKVNYFGTLRGRVGFAQNAWLAYVTGGLAYTTIKRDGTLIAGGAGSYSSSNTKTGWTLGGGLEWGFAPRWTAGLEYLYMSFSGDTNTYTTTVPAVTATYSKTTLNVLRLKVNYRF